jgi:Ca2+-binding RTX toxin-like protein
MEAPMPDPVLYAEGETDIGNTRETALSIAPVSVVTGYSGAGDWGDLFRFEMPDVGRVTLLLDGLSGDIELALVNADGETVRQSTRSWSNPETIDAAVAAGSWYVRVYPYSNFASDYRLSVTAVSIVEGTAVDDQLTGTIGNDTLYGLGGDDTLTGAEGDDLLVGSRGDDLIEGGAGHDRLFGGDGNDMLLGGDGNDTIAGGDGHDLIKTGTSVSAYAWQNHGDQAWGGAGNDTLASGGQGNATLGGGAGDDLIDTRTGGKNLIWGGDGNDTILTGEGGDIAGGGDGNDLMEGGAATDRLTGGTGADTLRGGAGDDRLAGGTGRDVIEGGAGDDTIFAGQGNDRLWGGTGADRFEFWREAGRDRIEDFNAAEGDILALGQSLWRAELGLLRPQEVVSIFGSIHANGHAVLDFGDAGTQVVLVGVTTLDGLWDALLLI